MSCRTRPTSRRSLGFNWELSSLGHRRAVLQCSSEITAWRRRSGCKSPLNPKSTMLDFYFLLPWDGSVHILASHQYSDWDILWWTCLQTNIGIPIEPCRSLCLIKNLLQELYILSSKSVNALSRFTLFNIFRLYKLLLNKSIRTLKTETTVET